MKLQHLIQQVFYEPALITPEAHASIRGLLEHRIGELADGHQGKFTREPGKDFCGNEVEVDQMEIIDGIAFIPIGGAIGQNLTPFDRGSGAVDVQDVSDELDEAEDNRKVRGIVLDMDSPGGMVLGTPELAERIREVDKPIYTFSRSLIASAAYWLASATDGIFTTRSASVGSIGVYLPVYDVSQVYEKRGVKVELIKAGTFKGIGFPGTSLTPEGRAQLQERVDYIYRMFAGHVRMCRGDGIADETMQGQTFMGGEAYERGLIDAIVRNRDEVAGLI